MENYPKGTVKIEEDAKDVKVGTESKQDAIADQRATNASHGHNEQGMIEGHGGDQQAAPTRDPQINLPNTRQ